MGNGPLYIDPAEWEAFLSVVRDRAHGKSLGWIVMNAYAFDTPFYDNGFYGIPRYTGTGYLNGKYYDRSELNYTAQGELWAAAGASPKVTEIIVRVWKIIPIGHWPNLNPSPGTLEMTELGYEHYKELYP
jgi:hypothetical protein